MRVRLFLIIGGLLGALTVTGCSKHAAPPSPADSAPSSLKGGFVGGADQTAIRAYLQSVHELKPKKFEMQWNPNTVAVSRDEAMRSLHAVNEDGSDYTFASSEPVVIKLQPGRIQLYWELIGS